MKVRAHRQSASCSSPSRKFIKAPCGYEAVIINTDLLEGHLIFLLQISENRLEMHTVRSMPVAATSILLASLGPGWGQPSSPYHTLGSHRHSFRHGPNQRLLAFFNPRNSCQNLSPLILKSSLLASQ